MKGPAVKYTMINGIKHRPCIDCGELFVHDENQRFGRCRDCRAKYKKEYDLKRKLLADFDD